MSKAAAAPNTRVGRLSHLDKSATLRLQSACNFINAEVARVRVKVLTITAIIVALGLAATVAAILSPNPLFAITPPFFTTIAARWYWARREKELAKTFKHVVVRRVVAALGNDLTYSAESSVTNDDLNAMYLFGGAPQWEVDDEVRGSKSKVTYTLFDAAARYHPEGSSKAHSFAPVFRGLIIRLDFNKNFLGRTVVLTHFKNASLGREQPDWGDLNIARMENVTFEKRFSVYSQDQHEARYLITPKLMELLLEADDALGGKLQASFRDNHLYLAVPRRDQFHIGILTRNLTPPTIAGDLTDIVALAERLIDTLELETRIWSRA